MLQHIIKYNLPASIQRSPVLAQNTFAGLVGYNRKIWNAALFLRLNYRQNALSSLGRCSKYRGQKNTIEPIDVVKGMPCRMCDFISCMCSKSKHDILLCGPKSCVQSINTSNNTNFNCEALCTCPNNEITKVTPTFFYTTLG